MDSRLTPDGLLIPGAMELRVSPRRLDTTTSHARKRLNHAISELIFINDSVCGVGIEDTARHKTNAAIKKHEALGEGVTAEELIIKYLPTTAGREVIEGGEGGGGWEGGGGATECCPFSLRAAAAADHAPARNSGRDGEALAGNS
jgi:hypothetical protein